MIRKMAKEVEAMMERKINAIKRIMEKAKSLTRIFGMKKDQKSST